MSDASDFSKLAGQMSAMKIYMDDVDVPKIAPIHKRVKLLTLMYRAIQVENKRISLLLHEVEEGDKA